MTKVNTQAAEFKLITDKKDALPDYEKHQNEEGKLEKYFEGK